MFSLLCILCALIKNQAFKTNDSRWLAAFRRSSLGGGLGSPEQARRLGQTQPANRNAAKCFKANQCPWVVNLVWVLIFPEVENLIATGALAWPLQGLGVKC